MNSVSTVTKGSARNRATRAARVSVSVTRAGAAEVDSPDGGRRLMGGGSTGWGRGGKERGVRQAVGRGWPDTCRRGRIRDANSGSKEGTRMQTRALGRSG